MALEHVLSQDGDKNGAIKREGPAMNKKVWYKQLWFFVVLAMVVGVALGHWFPNIGVLIV